MKKDENKRYEVETNTRGSKAEMKAKTEQSQKARK
jgi:hypothetical protein